MYENGFGRSSGITKAFGTSSSKFFCASLATVLGLYFLLTLLLLVIFELNDLPLEYLLIASLVALVIDFLVSPNLMDLSLNLLYKISWKDIDEVPEHLRVFLTTICESKRIKLPKIGIIDDGSPNAFTYGRTPNSARIVITKGTIRLLSEDELKAVVAHEMGHVVHFDMLLMTVAQFVPLVSYYIYKTAFKMAKSRSSSSSKNKSSGVTEVIGMLAFIVYIISEYIVLWFSRIREYYADQYSGYVTGNPNYLANALVKIGYGLKNDTNEEKNDAKVHAISSLGICDEKTMKTLSLSSHMNTDSTKSFDEETLRYIARWDLWNPWAGFYEFNSTHPLIAKRLKNLSAQAEEYGFEPFARFDEKKPESYWDDFFKDVAIYLLPIITLIIAVVGGIIFSLAPIQKEIFGIAFGTDCFNANLGLGAILFAISCFISLIYTHPNREYPLENVKSLLKNVKVSAVKPVPCTINGKIIGKGTPGYVFSEDFVIEDETGIIFIDYNQPLAIFNLLFSLLKSNKYIDENVEVKGWYRRSPVPYIEIKTIKLGDKIRTCYTYIAQIVAAFLIMCGGMVSIFSSIS